MVRYGLVSVVALVVDFGSLLTLNSLLGVHYLSAATVAFILGLATNYSLSNNRIFTDPKIKNNTLNFVAFGVIGIIGLLGNNILLWLFHERLGLSVAIAKLISVAIIFFWNFLARRHLLYQGHKTTKETGPDDE